MASLGWVDGARGGSLPFPPPEECKDLWRNGWVNSLKSPRHRNHTTEDIVSSVWRRQDGSWPAYPGRAPPVPWNSVWRCETICRIERHLFTRHRLITMGDCRRRFVLGWKLPKNLETANRIGCCALLRKIASGVVSCSSTLRYKLILTRKSINI